MMKQLFLSLTLIMLLLAGCATAAQDEPQPFPTDVVTEIQSEMDDLTAGGLPPGAIVWIDAPAYRYEGASGLAEPRRTTAAMPPEGAFRIGSITKMFTASGDHPAGGRRRADRWTIRWRNGCRR